MEQQSPETPSTAEFRKEEGEVSIGVAVNPKSQRKRKAPKRTKTAVQRVDLPRGSPVLALSKIPQASIHLSHKQPDDQGAEHRTPTTQRQKQNEVAKQASPKFKDPVPKEKPTKKEHQGSSKVKSTAHFPTSGLLITAQPKSTSTKVLGLSQKRNSAGNQHEKNQQLSKQAYSQADSPQKKDRQQIISYHLKKFFKDSKQIQDKPDTKNTHNKSLAKHRQKSAEAMQTIKQASVNSESEYQIRNPAAAYQQASVGERHANSSKPSHPKSRANHDQEPSRRADRDKGNYLQLIGNVSQKPLETHKSLNHQRDDRSQRSRSFFSDVDRNNSHILETSPVRRNLFQNPGMITKLHEKVIWFYRSLCDEYGAPQASQFISETIPTCFKTVQDRQLMSADFCFTKQSSFEDIAVPLNNPSLSKQTSLARMPHAGVARLYLSMFNEKNVQPICDTLRKFQSKIKILEIHLNAANAILTVSELQNQAANKQERLASPIRPNHQHSCRSFPKPHELFRLIKSLRAASTLKIVCESDQSSFIQENQYAAFIGSFGRQQPKDEDYLINSPDKRAEREKKKKTAPLSVIEIQGCQFKPSFYKIIVKAIDQRCLSCVSYLSLVSCAIQDPEGSTLLKAIIHGRQTPNLRAVNLSKNLLGFKFGSGLIAMLIDAQSNAQEETMQAVSKANGKLNKFDSLDHFSLKKIDLEYNKLSHLVIQTVEKLLTNLCNFKDQAKVHQNFIQTSQAAGQRNQQGSHVANYEIQPSKVIIEETQETDSESASQISQESFENANIAQVLEDFLSKNKSPNRRKQGAGCKTPTSYGESSVSRLSQMRGMSARKQKSMNFKRDSHSKRLQRFGSFRSVGASSQGKESDDQGSQQKEHDLNYGGRKNSLNKSSKKVNTAAASHKVDQNRSPKVKHIDGVFENMKKQIIEAVESPLMPHNLNDRYKSPEPKGEKEKSRTPILEREGPLNDENLNLSREGSSYFNGDSGKVNKNVMSLQLAKKRTLDIPIFDASNYGTHNSHRQKSPKNSIRSSEKQSEKQSTRPAAKRVKVASRGPFEKLEKTNSEIKNFMDPKQVAARTNFRPGFLRSSQNTTNYEDDSAQSDLTPSNHYSQQSYPSARPVKGKKKKGKPAAAKPRVVAKNLHQFATYTNSTRASLIKKDAEVVETYLTTNLKKAGSSEDLPTQKVSLVVPSSLKPTQGQRLNFVKSPPLQESQITQARPTPHLEKHKNFPLTVGQSISSSVVHTVQSLGPSVPNSATKAPAQPQKQHTLAKNKSPRLSLTQPHSGTASAVKTKQLLSQHGNANFLTLREMSKATLNVIRDAPKMPALTMQRSSSAEDLSASPGLNVERARGRNSTLSSHNTELATKPMQRPSGRKEPKHQKEEPVETLPSPALAWETQTYSTLGRPPLSKQALKKSVNIPNADHPVDFEDSGTVSALREEEMNIIEFTGTQSSALRPSATEAVSPSKAKLIQITMCEFDHSASPKQLESRLLVHQQNSTELNRRRVADFVQTHASKAESTTLRVVPHTTAQPSTDLAGLSSEGTWQMDVSHPRASARASPTSILHASPQAAQRPNQSKMIMKKANIAGATRPGPTSILPFLTQTQSWMDRTCQSIESQPPDSHRALATASGENLAIGGKLPESLAAKASGFQHHNATVRSMPSLPDASKGTDEDEPLRFQTNATVEQDPSMLADELGKEKSDVGQRLNRYAGRARQDSSSKGRNASTFSS